MDCQDIRKIFSSYLEGIVSPEDQELIDQHLASCRACSTALYELNRTGEVLKNLKEVEPPPWMTQKIMARVREEAESKRGFIQKLFYPLHIKVPLEAFATVLIAVIAVYVFKAVEPEMKGLQTRLPGSRLSPVKKLLILPKPRLRRHRFPGRRLLPKRARQNRCERPGRWEKETEKGTGGRGSRCRQIERSPPTGQ